MNILIEKNSQYGLVVSSRAVAKELGKLHKNVIRDLEQISIGSDLSQLIIPSNYRDSKNRNYKEYLLTKDGFTLYMFNIQGYNEFKMAYIRKFNEMEKMIYSVRQLPIEYPVKKDLEVRTFGGTPVMEIKLLSQITGLSAYQITIRAKGIGVPTLTREVLKEYKTENRKVENNIPRLMVFFKEHVINICKYYEIYEKVKDIIENYFKSDNRISYKEERDVLGRTYQDRIDSTKRMIKMIDGKINDKLKEIEQISKEINSYREHISFYMSQI